MRAAIRHLALVSAAAGCTVPAGAQGPLREVEARRDGLVSFRFAGRSDVCGFGGTTLRIGGTGPFDRSVMTWTSGDGWGPCERGPVGVLLTRAEGVTVGVRVGIGQGPLPEGTADLGAVPSATAGAYLLELAERSDGRVAREVLLAAVIADSVETWRGLIRLGTNRSLGLGLRESALGWLGREGGLADPAGQREIVGTLLRVARDRDETLALRRRSVSALGRAGPEGVSGLLELAESRDAQLARVALEALAGSGDPRARELLRRTARDGTQPEAVRAEAMKALAGRDAAPSDFAFLRDLYPGLASGTERTAVIDVLARAGGSANLRWLLGLARDQRAGSEDRRRAARGAVQAGATSEDLIPLYDAAGDRRLKEAVIEQLMRLGDRAAVAKVTAIARSDTDPAVRRAAVQRLARTGDPEIASALRALIEPQ